MKKLILLSLSISLIAAMLWGFISSRLCYDSIQQVDYVKDNKVQYDLPRSLYVERYGPDTCVYGVTMSLSLDSMLLPPKLQQGQIIRIYAWKNAVDNRSNDFIIPAYKVAVIADKDPGAAYIHTFAAIMDVGPYVVGCSGVAVMMFMLFHRKKAKGPEEAPAASAE